MIDLDADKGQWHGICHAVSQRDARCGAVLLRSSVSVQGRMVVIGLPRKYYVKLFSNDITERIIQEAVRESLGDGFRVALAAEDFTGWLSCTVHVAADGNYRHQRLSENADNRERAIAGLILLVREAHDDAVRHLAELAGNSLDPLGPPATQSFAPGYPGSLTMKTLKGYFGEVFAAIVAENFAPFGITDWHVPAFLFRFHHLAFFELEAFRQDSNEPGTIPGNSGDDCLAFQRDQSGRITRSLVCEAKCTADHDAGLLSDAYEKLSKKSYAVPLSVYQVIDVLLDRDDEEAREWIRALRALAFKAPARDYERCNLVTYVCGRAPKKGETWITPDKAHDLYTGRNRLEAVEVHVERPDDLIRRSYRPRAGHRDAS